MPPDHINISHPEEYSPSCQRYRDRLEIERLRVELKQLDIYHRCVSDNLEAIFTRIERGDPAELHYPDGRIFVVTGTEKG